ncbi:MAG: ribosome-associated translation inhibitor RaiA [Patescibacteria group bacterium]|jgi:ribosomal subunit interface protein
MSITISGKDFKLDEALKVYITKKVEKIDQLLPGVPTKIKVELDFDHNQKTGLINRVEISVEMPGENIKAGQKAEHMREAIDLCMPKLIRQIKKFKSSQHKSEQPGNPSIKNLD